MTRRKKTVSLDEALELNHFAYRQLVAEADRILARHGLARLHQRILYACRRNPGLSVGELLRMLEISKQGLHRPLLQLVQTKLLVSSPDPSDRRVRLLMLTPKGAELEKQLADLQRKEFARAFRAVGEEGALAWARVMSIVGHGKSSATLRGTTTPKRR